MYTRSPYQGHRRCCPPQLTLPDTLLSFSLYLSLCPSLARPRPLQPAVSPVELIYQSIRRFPRDHATTIRPSCTGSSPSVLCYRICVACSLRASGLVERVAYASLTANLARLSHRALLSRYVPLKEDERGKNYRSRFRS